MEESGWGDGPHTGPSASGDPHDKENDELIEEDEAMEDDEDEEDDESDEEEEDTSEEEWETLDDDNESTLLEESDNSGDENAETCPICLNRLRDQDIGMPETCDHTFCLECIQEWAKNVNTCPVDRQVFHLILARHPGQDKIFQKFPVEEHNVLEEEEVAEEDDLTYCEVCNQCDREDKLLLCDGCDLGYHMDCLVPPLRRVPVEEWFCPECDATSYNQSVAEVMDDFEETSELIAENRDRLMPTRLRATVTTTQAQSVRHSHRRIPRTLLSERVREAIEETRRRRIQRILSSSEDGEEEEEDMEGTMEESTTETLSSTAAKKKVVTQKKTTRKRKTTRRKRKGKKRKTTKRRKRKTKTGKRKTGKRRVKTRRRKTARTVQEWKESLAKSHTPLTVKGRIAGALGLSKPPPGRMIPLQKLPGDKSLDMRRSEVGITSLSIFGSRDQLDPSYEDEDIQQPGSSKEAAESQQQQQQQQPHSRHSRSALYSHRPIGRIPARLIAKLESSLEPVESTSNSAACVGPIDLLGSIMQGQKVLHMQGKDVTIHRDGSLSTKKPLVDQIPKNKSKDFSDGKELPSLFGSISKTASNEKIMQSTECSSNKAGNLSINAELDVRVKKEMNSSLTEEYDPAHPTDDLEEVDEIPMQTDRKTSLEDEYDPAHPTDDMEEEKMEETREEIVESKEAFDHQVKSDKGDNFIYGKDVKNIKDEKNSKNTINMNTNYPKSKYGKDVKNKSNSIKIKLKTDSKFLLSFNPVESSSHNLEESMVKIETVSEKCVNSTEKDLKGSEETMIDSEKNLLESSESESKQISCKVSSKVVIDMFADESVEHNRNLIEMDITNKNSGAPFMNEEKDRINYNCNDSSVMERSLIGSDAEKVISNEAENLDENDASNSKFSDGSETDGSKHNGDAESDNQGKVDIIDKDDKVGDGENVNENTQVSAKEEAEVEDKETPFIDHRSIAQVLQLLAKSGEEQKKGEEGEREPDKDKVSTKRSQERDKRERHHDKDKSRDRSDMRKGRHRRSRSRDRKSRSHDKRSRSQEKRSRDKRSRSHDKPRRSRSRDRSRKKHDRSRSRSRDRKRKRNRDRSQERSRSKERSKSNERDSSRSRRRSKDRDLDTRSSSRHSDEYEKENAYYTRQERQREIKSLMDIDVSAGMKRMRERTDHADVDYNEKHKRCIDEETTEEERIDQIENMHCSTERSHSPNSDHEMRGRRRENWMSLPENRGFTTSLDSSSPVDNSVEFFEEEERSQESLLGPGPSSIHLGKPIIGNCFPPPPPPPPPPTTLIVSQDPEMIQVSGPPGHGLLGEGPLILQGPHPGDSPLFQHRMPLSLGLNVVPPRFHQHLGPHQRHFLFNPFLNRPPISRFHLPGGPPLGWPPQMIPFGARIAPEGIVGHAGLYDSLPPETALSQPLLPPQSETLSNVMVPTSEAILLPVSLETDGGAIIPSSMPRPHSVLSLPLQPPPHSAISVTDTIRTSTVITTAAPQLLTTSNVTESSNAPKPGGMISIKLQELSQLLNTQAKLASLNKSKDNSVDRNSDRTNKLIEQKDENIFKVPLPPPPSGAKTTNRNNVNSGEVMNEVVDMDMSSPMDNEDLIELPETGGHQNKLSEQKMNENEANPAKRKSETKENRHRNHDLSRKKGDKEKGTKDDAKIQKNTVQSESDVTSSAKICHSANTKNGEVHSEKIKALVDAYVEKFNRKKEEAIALDSPD
ncbi:hypothetical protein CHS0354_030166 [Potamilus streckersoni]|uniref:PHD and RING finger domain-containing protein 1 n=1 Tax=Potamilus streckersoni TaxID=2493646 RepID=A0AAE0W151_9BIVA|nr:hypothetical protein CHS0354_030166 [Potamilus streckersoni]